ncbi:MAG: type II restriction endonuclease [Dehalococcoidia bacterium]
MPTSREVVQEACTRLGYLPDKLPAERARRDFNALLRRLFEDTLTVLEEHERQVDAGQVLPELVRMQRSDIDQERDAMRSEGDDTDALHASVVRLLRKWHQVLRGLFLSVSQSRKQRGGKDFEYQIQTLLGLAQIPHEVQPKRERSDFIFPSTELLHKDRPKAVLLSAKRTLRERWQQVVNELQQVQCPNTYLATAEDRIAQNALNGIKARNIYLVVWDELKNESYAGEPLVVGYSQFIRDLTQHFLRQWQ